MKTTMTLTVATILLIGAIGASATASGNLLPVDQAMSRVSAAGYTPTGEIELDDGTYEIESTDANGRRIEVHIDAASGEILSPLQPGQIALSIDQIRDRLAQAGYTDVHELERDDGHWSAEVRGAYGLERELRVHPLTGSIVSDSVDD
jgi:uncharacterized membrane protein YkoI